jgi:hypothetical protein
MNLATSHGINVPEADILRSEPREFGKSPTGKKLHWRDYIVGAQDLCDERFPDMRFIVPGLIPEGMTLLVSRPKLGKSWMLLQIGAAIANGTSTLVANEHPACGDVLYLSLEDGRRRMQRRMTKYFGGLRDNHPRRLTFAHAWKRFDQGGLQDLGEWCRSKEKPALIMIDTLKKVRPPKRRNQSDYDADYEACEGMLALTHEFPGLAIIAAHHDRKADADNVFDTVSGTLGLIGGVDTIAILKRNGQGVTLYVEGRDLIEEIEKAINFDRETCRWAILGEAAEIHQSETRKAILATLCAAQAPMGPAEIAEASGIKQATVRQQLYKMSTVGQVVGIGSGKYCHPARGDLLNAAPAITPVTPVTV